MKKKSVLFLLVGVLALSTLMTGCGKKDIKDVTIEDIGNMSDEELEDYLEEAWGYDDTADYPTKDELEEEKAITYDKHDASAMWDASVTYGEGTQILDVYIHQGEKMKDVIASLENSKYEWEYTYNPQATVSSEKTLDVSLNGEKWFNIQMKNYTNEDEIIQDEANVIFVNISYGTATENVRYFKDYFLADINALTMDELAGLKDTMFATLPIVDVTEKQSDTTATYTYNIAYPVVMEMGDKTIGQWFDEEGRMCATTTYTFTYDFEKKETKMTSFSMITNYQYSELAKLDAEKAENADVEVEVETEENVEEVDNSSTAG